MAETTEKTVHELLAESLVAHGVSHIFGLVGDANLFMVDAFVKSGKGRYVGCAHEASTITAAIGYAQASRKTGVATITHGPGLTNTITALVEGVKGCIPVVVLCGDTPPNDIEHLQHVDQRELIKATGAGFIELRNPSTATQDLARAFRQATVERRPVVLNMRVDLQWEKAPAIAPPVMQVPDIRAAVPEGADFDEALGMIASARRPIVLAGRGATNPEARAAILALARRLEAPVATTLKGSGLFHGEDFNLGVFGTLSTPLTVDVILQSDCVVAFGASLGWLTTATGAYLKGKRVVQVLGDLLPNERRTEPGIVLVGDPERTALRMIEVLDEAEIPPSGNTDDDLRKRLQDQAEEYAKMPDFAKVAPGTIDLFPTLRRLESAVPKNRVLVTDLGRFIHSAWKSFHVTAPEKLIYTAHFASIGLGLSEAIGAATATQDQTTVLITGDGGFLMSGLTELSTAIREKLDLVIIVCNDGSYGAEHIQFTRRSMDPTVSLLAPPDFAAVAKAMGADAVRVTDKDQISAAVEAISSRKGPVLIDLVLDPYTVSPT
ncbi:MAG: thiamine pyrophosphate-binding protein [Rhizobiaceae bacterium]